MIRYKRAQKAKPADVLRHQIETQINKRPHGEQVKLRTIWRDIKLQKRRI